MEKKLTWKTGCLASLVRIPAIIFPLIISVYYIVLNIGEYNYGSIETLVIVEKKTEGVLILQSKKNKKYEYKTKRSGRFDVGDSLYLATADFPHPIQYHSERILEVKGNIGFIISVLLTYFFIFYTLFEPIIKIAYRRFKLKRSIDNQNDKKGNEVV